MQIRKEPRHKERKDKVNKLPTLSKAATLDPSKVMKYLSRIPQSKFVGIDHRALNKALNPHIARRHLIHLILLNDRDKSNFAKIIEESEDQESSRMSNFIEN